MTDQPDDQPTPQERAAFALAVNEDLAVARRLLAALHAGDHQGVNAVTVEYVRSGRGVQVTQALALQALDWAEQLEPDPAARQQELDRLAMQQMDAAEALAGLRRDDPEP
jgi:hypothetical protein